MHPVIANVWKKDYKHTSILVKKMDLRGSSFFITNGENYGYYKRMVQK